MACLIHPVKPLLTAIGLALLVFFAPNTRAQNNPPGTPLPPTPNAAPNLPPNSPAPKPSGPNDTRKNFPPQGFAKNDIEIREKLETLSQLTPQQLDAELQKWPRYQQMDLGERVKLLQRIQEYKERRRHQAENKARDLGLQLNPEQFTTFGKKFWEKRLPADRQLR